MSDMKLQHNEKLDIDNILEDLDKYRPKRRGWTWRTPEPKLHMGPFEYQDATKPLENGIKMTSDV